LGGKERKSIGGRKIKGSGNGKETGLKNKKTGFNGKKRQGRKKKNSESYRDGEDKGRVEGGYYTASETLLGRCPQGPKGEEKKRGKNLGGKGKANGGDRAQVEKKSERGGRRSNKKYS